MCEWVTQDDGFVALGAEYHVDRHLARSFDALQVAAHRQDVRAQEDDYAQALSDLRAGRKRTHWIWYIFLQIDSLAFSSTSKRYAIKSVDEARAYLDHPVLGPRLLECAGALLRVEGKSATEILGSPDDMKLRSCATLFASALPAGSVFDRLLEKYYRGERDGKTVQLLGLGERL